MQIYIKNTDHFPAFYQTFNQLICPSIKQHAIETQVQISVYLKIL